MAGQLTLRAGYRRLATDWFDRLVMSPDEPAKLAAPAGWQVADVFPASSMPLFSPEPEPRRTRVGPVSLGGPLRWPAC